MYSWPAHRNLTLWNNDNCEQFMGDLSQWILIIRTVDNLFVGISWCQHVFHCGKHVISWKKTRARELTHTNTHNQTVDILNQNTAWSNTEFITHIPEFMVKWLLQICNLQNCWDWISVQKNVTMVFFFLFVTRTKGFNRKYVTGLLDADHTVTTDKETQGLGRQYLVPSNGPTE
jgi:hypothetical protein